MRMKEGGMLILLPRCESEVMRDWQREGVDRSILYPFYKTNEHAKDGQGGDECERTLAR